MEEFQNEFNARLQARVGELTMQNIGQQLRIEMMAQQLQAQAAQIAALSPKPAGEEHKEVEQVQ